MFQLEWRQRIIGKYPSRDMLLCAMAQDAARNGQTIRTIESDTFKCSRAADSQIEMFFLSVMHSNEPDPNNPSSIGTVTYSALKI